MVRSLALLAAASLAAGSLSACASGPPERRGGPPQGAAYQQSVFLSGASLLFVQFDADRDYVTTRAEAEAGITSEWARASEGGTVMTPIQFSAWSARALGGPNIGPYRLAFDTNVNNEITAPEFKAAILAKFDQFDASKDGALQRPEMTERLPERPRGPGGAGPGPGGAGGEGPPGGRPPRR
jgi:hypothetical protein